MPWTECPPLSNVPTPVGVERLAESFSRAAHGEIDQRRKYTLEPYIVHPAAVAKKLKERFDDPVLIAGAWCHDVMEDTKRGFAQIEAPLGSEVAKLVWEVSDIGSKDDGDRKTRKALDLRHIARGSERCHWIKYKDALDNLISLEAHAPNFALIWIDEKLEMASVLRHLPKTETMILKESLWQAKARIETLGLNSWLEKRSAFNGCPR